MILMDKPHLLKVKAKLKARTPKFIRQDAHKHKRLAKVWRAPKGLHSKMKDSRRGYRYKLQGGYQSPAAVRGMNKHGLVPTLVTTVKQLDTMDPKVQSVIVAAGLGGRKKIIVLEAAAAKKFMVANKSPDAAEKMKSAWEAKTSQKKEHDKAKEAKKKTLEAKAEETAKKKSEKDAENGEKSDEKSASDEGKRKPHAHPHPKSE